MKVAIVGAGISGLYLGWKLAERGEETTVFEKREKIGKISCSGLFSQRIFQFIPQSQKLVQNQINYTKIYLASRTLKIQFSKPFFILSHFELDNLVAELAREAGAKIVLNQNIKFLPQGFDRVIGCDGPNSSIRQILGLPNPSFRLAIQGFLQKEDYSDSVETWPTKSGFIWRIPRGKEIEYGVIEKPKEAKIIFEEFLNKNNLFLERMSSGLIPQGFIIPKNQNITLCGDSAGLTKPWSGGGVIWGLLASDLLLKYFPDFLKYQKEARKFFLKKIFFSKITTKLFYFLGDKTPWLFPKNIKIESDFLL